MVNQAKPHQLISTNSRVGRPKAMTQEVVRELTDCFRKGMDVRGACILSGVSTSTYYKELASNKQFSDKMTLAQNETTIFANLVVKNAIEKKQDVKTARWWIDRQDKLASKALRAREYRFIKKLTLTDKHERTKSVQIDLA